MCQKKSHRREIDDEEGAIVEVYDLQDIKSIIESRSIPLMQSATVRELGYIKTNVPRLLNNKLRDPKGAFTNRLYLRL